MLTMKDYVTGLAGLTPKELDELGRRIKVLQSFNGGSIPVDDSSDDALFVLNRLANAMESVGVGRPSHYTLKRLPDKPFMNKVPGIMKFFQTACHGRAEQACLMELAFSMLYKRQCRRPGYIPSARTIIAEVERLPALLDHAFPGYAAAGLLGYVLRASNANGR
jgi:hypothetical protein